MYEYVRTRFGDATGKEEGTGHGRREVRGSGDAALHWNEKQRPATQSGIHQHCVEPS